MAALSLHIGCGPEGRTDQKKHRRLVLPIVGTVKQRAAQHAVAEDGAGRDQRNGRDDDDDVVTKGETTFERGRERIARCSIRTVMLISELTMHHAETSDASFNRLAAVAVFAP